MGAGVETGSRAGTGAGMRADSATRSLRRKKHPEAKTLRCKCGGNYWSCEETYTSLGQDGERVITQRVCVLCGDRVDEVILSARSRRKKTLTRKEIRRCGN